MKHLFKSSILLLSACIFLWSCSDDEDDNPMPMETTSIVDAAIATNTLSSLVAALQKADESANNDLVAALADENGTFTVLAPTNDAFADLFSRLDGYSSLDDFDTAAEQDLLATILTYHVVAGAAVTSGMLSDGQTVQTLQTESLTVSTQGGVFFTDAAGESAQVTTADVATDNGVVHIINKVLLPQAAIDALNGVLLFTITDTAVGNADLSSLVAALQLTGLDAVLDDAGSYTVFAPTNDAFTTFLDGATLADFDTEDGRAALAQILLNHVIGGAEITSDDLVAAGSGYASTLADGPVDGTNLSLYYDTSDGVEFNGVSSVVDGGANVKATNGIVHVVDAVIDLPTVVDHALANDNFSSLVGALTDGGNTVDFVSVLSDEDALYTVFAPINDAFAAFTNPDANVLQDILLNHVIGETVALSDGLATGYVNTLATFDEGENLSMYINTADGVLINGISTVALTDVVTTNGVIHAVDTVIDIPSVVTFAAADATFAPLVTALTTATPATDFVATLTGDGPFTVFAPTADAFQALLDSNDDWTTVDDIDEDLLTAVLQHHVVNGSNVRSGDLTPDGDTVAPTLEGDDITITLPGTGDNIADVTDGSANDDIGIVVVDVQAGNGVIHVLNKVMIPTVDVP